MKFANFVAVRYININGKMMVADDAVLHADNRAYRYGYGLFETMLCLGGEIQLKAYHWERLFSGMAQLGMHTPKFLTPEYLEEEVLRIIRKNKLEKICRLRLQVSGGNGWYFRRNRAGSRISHRVFPFRAFRNAFK